MIDRPHVSAALLASLLALAAPLAQAQNPAAAAAQAPAPAPPTTPAAVAAEPMPPMVETAAPDKVKEAHVEHLVSEDSQVRIEETRVRGVTTRIVVHPKIPGMPAYEIQPRNPAVDPQNDKSAGMRLFNFSFGH